MSTSLLVSFFFVMPPTFGCLGSLCFPLIFPLVVSMHFYPFSLINDSSFVYEFKKCQNVWMGEFPCDPLCASIHPHSFVRLRSPAFFESFALSQGCGSLPSLSRLPFHSTDPLFPFFYPPRKSILVPWQPGAIHLWWFHVIAWKKVGIFKLRHVA